MNQQKEETDFVSKEVLTRRAGLEFLAIACVIGVVVYCGYCHMNRMLTEALENSVERSIHTIAYEIGKQMNIEIDFLESQSRNIESGRVAVNDLFTIMDDSRGKHAGIIFPNGEVTTKNIPAEDIVGACKEVFDGKKTVRYLRGIGLIFAVPISYNGQDCVLFDYYNDGMVREFFKTVSYNGDGTIILMNDRINWTVIADGIPPLINTHPDMDAAWEAVAEKNGYDPVTETAKRDSGAICYQFQDKPYFVYVATVLNEYSFAISGYVPWYSVAVGFQAMYTGLLIVFGLITLALIMAARMIISVLSRKITWRIKRLKIKAISFPI